MSNWKIKQIKSLKINNPVMIEGLPGIGNVGKVTVDFLIDELNAEKIYEISSYTFPHSVFVNEKNLVEMPKIEVYFKRVGKGKKEFLFLAGDVQPTDEVSSYEFSEKIIDMCRNHNCKDIITLGGVGLMDVPKKPKIYCTGNTKKAVEKYKDKEITTNLYGIVGPIVGVSGLLLGMADKNMDAVALLAETYGHPMYLGFKSSKEVLKYLNKKFSFGLKIEKLDKEIKDMEEDMIKRTEELTRVSKQTAAEKIKRRTDVNYIG